MNQPRSSDPNVYMVDLLVDDDTAIATPDQFDRLMEYSASLPTGMYEGKRWKAKVKGGWRLGEFYETAELTAQGQIGLRWRELLVVS